jgi:hypothetical protein
MLEKNKNRLQAGERELGPKNETGCIGGNGEYPSLQAVVFGTRPCRRD